MSEFHKESRKKDGLCSHCKECESIRCRKRIEKDPEAYRKSKKENARKHADKKKPKTRARYLANKEEILSKSREFYHKDRDRILARRKKIGKSPESKKKDAERQSKWQKEHRENVRIAAIKYAKTHREKVNEWHHKWQKDNLVKARAQSNLKNHIRRGSIVRPDKCEVCMKECKPHGHHEDYTKPLDVQWLCKICHNHKHGKLMDVKP